MVRRLLTVCFGFCFALTIVFVWPETHYSKAQSLTAHIATGTGGAVTSVDALATQAGIDVLKAGGNAVDVVIATAATLGVTEPFSAGIGGGGFMLIYQPDRLSEFGE